MLWWGGLRGGISIALALSLPPGPVRDLVLAYERLERIEIGLLGLAFEGARREGVLAGRVGEGQADALRAEIAFSAEPTTGPGVCA